MPTRSCGGPRCGSGTPELDKPAKGLLRRFLGRVAGLSRAQLTRLIGHYRATGRIEDRRRGPARPFERRYTAADVRQLAEADEILGDLCGAATRRVMNAMASLAATVLLGVRAPSHV